MIPETTQELPIVAIAEIVSTTVIVVVIILAVFTNVFERNRKS